jgi:16S rRNA (adenine1518-N6/adenine1519-N6)-dimethyltransferase
MMSIDDLPPLREVIRRHELSAKKSLGQNFLLDLNLTARIARAAGPLKHATIVEVGPGPGGLTRALLAEGAKRVIAIERDTRAIAALSEIAEHYPGRLRVVAADALELDVRDYLDAGSCFQITENRTSGKNHHRAETGADAPRSTARVVANLPYNIATKLLISWITTEPWPPWYDQLVLMFQREVAERIVARPGNKTYGRLSVITQWRCEPKILFDVAPSAFVPRPKVTSSLMRIVPRRDPLSCECRMLERVTEAAFGQRRKMLRQSLKSLGVDPLPLLDHVGLDPTARAEDIPVAGFVALTRAVADHFSIRNTASQT